MDRGQTLIDDARTLLPALSCDDRVRVYYRMLMQLIKAQTQLHKVFAGEAFKKYVYYGVEVRRYHSCGFSPSYP